MCAKGNSSFANVSLRRIPSCSSFLHQSTSNFYFIGISPFSEQKNAPLALIGRKRGADIPWYMLLDEWFIATRGHILAHWSPVSWVIRMHWILVYNIYLCMRSVVPDAGTKGMDKWLNPTVSACVLFVSWWRHQRYTFSALLALCAGREFAGHQWIPRTKASDVELWCFLWSAPETVE